MSTTDTTLQQFSPPSSSRKEEPYRIHEPSSNSTPMLEINCSPGRRLQEEQPNCQKLIKTENLTVQPPLTPPVKKESTMEDVRIGHLRTSLTLAVAMKVATSPAASSFPDDFWAPFIDQEEYEGKKMLEERQRQIARWQARMTNERNAATGNRFCQVIINVFHWFLKTCFRLVFLLLLASVLNAPYFRSVFESLVLIGRLVLGMGLWFHVFVMGIVSIRPGS